MDEHKSTLHPPDRDGALAGASDIPARSQASEAGTDDDVSSPPPAGWRAPFASLANKDFRYIWLGMLFLAAGVEMELVAIGYLV